MYWISPSSCTTVSDAGAVKLSCDSMSVTPTGRSSRQLPLVKSHRVPKESDALIIGVHADEEIANGFRESHSECLKFSALAHRDDPGRQRRRQFV